MSYFDRYKERIKANGNTVADVYANNTDQLVNEVFSNSPNYKVINLAGVLTETRVLDGDTSFKKTLVVKPGTVIRRGSYAIVNGQNWLVFDYQIGSLFPKADIRICNGMLTIQTGVTKTVTSTDSLGRPITKDTPTYTSWYCVIDGRTNPTSDLNEPINMPDNTILLTIPYTDNQYVAINTEFDLWGSRYKIANIDKSKVVGNEGLLIITAQMVV